MPVNGGPIRLHYQAGTLLTVDVGGYVTGDAAARSTAGLSVPVTSTGAQPVQVAPDGTADVLPLPASGGAVPAERVAAVLLGVIAVGDVTGIIAVYPPDAAPPANPILVAGGGAARQTTTFVRAVNATVRVGSQSGGLVTLLAQLATLTG